MDRRVLKEQRVYADYLDLDDQLLKEAMQDSGETTEQAVVEAGLRLLIQMSAQSRIRELRGNVYCSNSLEEMRTDHSDQ